MTKIYPMLSHTGKQSDLKNPNFIYEAKLDGIRCIVYIDDGGIHLQSRTGKYITDSFPDITCRLFPLLELNYTLVLDGEIVVYDDDNELASPPNFQKLQTRLQRKLDIADAVERVPARFVAFDCLQINGLDMLHGTPLDERRANLLDVYRHHPGCFSLSPKHENGQTLFDYVTKFGYEGVIAKRHNSVYSPGTRSHDWLKIKPVKHATVYIGGYTYGVGRRSESVGALIALEYVAQGSGDLAFAGLVGTGLTDEVASQIRTLMDAHGIEPNGNNPWNIPRAVQNRVAKLFLYPKQMEVTYQERTKDGIMRFPAFKRLVS